MGEAEESQMKIYVVGYEIKPEFKVAQRSGETIPRRRLKHDNSTKIREHR